jgi:hypothetical protein
MAQTEAQIARLELRLKQLRARQARVASLRRRQVSQQERKDDTRRKILVGAVVLAKVKQGGLSDAELREWLEGALKRADDRALFGFDAGNRGSAAG